MCEIVKIIELRGISDNEINTLVSLFRNNMFVIVRDIKTGLSTSIDKPTMKKIEEAENKISRQSNEILKQMENVEEYTIRGTSSSRPYPDLYAQYLNDRRNQQNEYNENPEVPGPRPEPF